MQKKFIINLFFLLGLNLLVKPFWIFGIDRTVQNAVGAEQYGLYFAVLNFSFLFSFLLDFGLTGFNNRNVAQHSHMINKYVSNILGMKALLALLYGVISIGVAFIIGYDTMHFKLFLWVGMNQLLSSLILFLRSNISGLQMFKTDSVISVLDRLLMIAFCSILIWGNTFDVEINIFYFASLQTLAYLVTALIAFIIVIRYSALKRIKWDIKLYRVLFRQSFPFAILTFLMLIYYRVDSVMIERILPNGSTHAGIYASAYRLLDAINMFAYLFAVLLLPLFSRMFAEKLDTGKIINIAASLLLSVSMLFAALAWFFPTQIIDLMYVEHLKESSDVLKVLLPGIIPISMIYVFGTLLTAHGSLKKLNIIALIGVVLNIGLNLILIPDYFEQGAAFASISTQFIVALSQLILVFTIIRPQELGKNIVLLLIFGVLLFGIGYILQTASIHLYYQMGGLTAFWLLFITYKTIILYRRSSFNILKQLPWNKS